MMDLNKKLSNKTELQSKIIKAINGYSVSEVVHTFEVIKLAMLLD